MLWFKECPRCGGDLYPDWDRYGSYIACLQCGYYLTEAEEVVLHYQGRLQLSAPPRAPELVSLKQAS